MLKSKPCVAVHFVWATWDRQPLITQKIECELWRYIETACTDDHCDVPAVGGMPGHVHLLALISNTLTLAELMKHVKGGSSLFVSDTLRPGEWFKWQGSYGAFSVSRPLIDTVVNYIQNQRQHHAEGGHALARCRRIRPILSVTSLSAKADIRRLRPTA